MVIILNWEDIIQKKSKARRKSGAKRAKKKTRRDGKSKGKRDACYYKVRRRYKKWPSAYASGALVQCRKKGAANWGNSVKKSESKWMQELSNSKKKLLNSKPSFNVEFPELSFPDNESEIPEVLNVMKKYEMDEDVKNDLDKNNHQMMLDIVGEDMNDWEDFIRDVDIHTIQLKMKYKRPRPYEVSEEIKSMTDTDDSPSFPSGHAIEAFALAKVLAEEHPENEEELFNMAEAIALSRVLMGSHYPSDIETGEEIGILIAEEYLDSDISKSWEGIIFKEWIDCSSCGKGKKRRSCGRADASKGKKRRCRPTCSACKDYKRRAGKKGKKKKRRKGTFSLEEKYGLHGWFKRRG